MTPSVFIRGTIYVIAAALPVWIAYFSGVVDALIDSKPVLQHWAVWVLTALQSIYQAIIALRAYIDGSNERSKSTPKDG